MLRDGSIDGLLDYSHPLFCERNCLCFLTVGSLRQLQDRRGIGMIQRRDPIARGMFISPCADVTTPRE